MILKEYKIYNFGILCNVSGTFDDGVNTIYNENGTGKTTLSEFIIAMLFGMPNINQKKTSEIRTHYAPFNGNKYGGELTFSSNGSEYKIERSFDQKKPSGDTCIIIKDGREFFCDKEIGEELLKIDYDSFRRVVLVSGDNARVGENLDNVKAKLSSSVADIDKLSLEKAKEGLSKEYSELTKRKTGKIAVAFYEMTENERRSKELSNIIENSDTIRKRVNEKRLDEQKLTAEYKEFQKIETAVGRHQNFLQMKKQHESLLCKQNEIKAKYPTEIPDGTSLSEIKRIERESEKINAEIFSLKSKEGDFDKTEETFPISEAEIRFRKYGVPKDEELQKVHEILSNISKYEANEDSLDKQISDEEEALNEKKKKRKIVGIVTLSASAAVIVLGALLLLIKSTFILLPAGIAFLAVAVIILLIKPSSKSSEKLCSEKEKLASQKADCCMDLDSIAAKYGYDISDYQEFVSLFNEDVLKYKENVTRNKILLDEKEKNKLEIGKKLLELQNIGNGLKEALWNTFVRFGLEIPENLSVFVNVVEQDKISISELQKEIDELSLEIEKYSLENREYLSIDVKKDVDGVGLEKALADAKEEREHAEEELDKITESENRLQEILRRIDEEKSLVDDMSKRATTLDRTKYFLDAAYNSIIAEYVGPVEKSLKNLVEKINSVSKLKLIITPDFELKYDSDMGTKDAASLSEGLQCVLELCYRMALAENLCKGDVPFVLLDDPLMSLDEKNLSDAKEIIKSISLQRQIIYFTCHKSRIIDTGK